MLLKLSILIIIIAFALFLGIWIDILPRKIIVEPIFYGIIEYKCIADINYALFKITPLAFLGNETKKDIKTLFNNLFVIHYLKRIDDFGKNNHTEFDSYDVWFNLFKAKVEARKKANNNKDEDFSILAEESWFLLNKLKTIETNIKK